MKESMQYYSDNQSTFQVWIDGNMKIPYSHDLLQPLIPEFLKANPGVNLRSCAECVIDMLRWYKKELKKETPLYQLSTALEEGIKDGSVKVKTFNERLDEVADNKLKPKKK